MAIFRQYHIWQWRNLIMTNIIDVIKSMPDYMGTNGRSEKEIIDAEKVLGVSFAKDYRKYLAEIGLACFDGRELTGLTQTPRLNVVTVTKEQREWFGDSVKSWYVIEEMNIDGIVIWQSPDGSVYQVAPHSKVQKIANSLAEYILQ